MSYKVINPDNSMLRRDEEQDEAPDNSMLRRDEEQDEKLDNSMLLAE